MRGLKVESVLFRLCGQYDGTVQHLLAVCTTAGAEYVRRHNNALMVLAAQWGQQHGNIEIGAQWNHQHWVKGEVMETDKLKLMWDFKYKLRKYNKASRLDITQDDRIGKHV